MVLGFWGLMFLVVLLFEVSGSMVWFYGSKAFVVLGLQGFRFPWLQGFGALGLYCVCVFSCFGLLGCGFMALGGYCFYVLWSQGFRVLVFHGFRAWGLQGFSAFLLFCFLILGFALIVWGLSDLGALGFQGFRVPRFRALGFLYAWVLGFQGSIVLGFGGFRVLGLVLGLWGVIALGFWCFNVLLLQGPMVLRFGNCCGLGLYVFRTLGLFCLRAWLLYCVRL